MVDYSEITQYIIVRNDLGMSPGKVAAQVGHGVELAYDLGKRYYPQWTPVSRPCAKIVLQANLNEINNLIYNFNHTFIARVIDEGRTEVQPGSLTVIATVPFPRNICDDFKNLKLYK